MKQLKDGRISVKLDEEVKLIIRAAITDLLVEHEKWIPDHTYFLGHETRRALEKEGKIQLAMSQIAFINSPMVMERIDLPTRVIWSSHFYDVNSNRLQKFID